MKKNQPLTRKSFDNLLAWLHPDREQAGEKYEHIRRTLISFFLSQGSYIPEELADETINRVAQKIDEIAEGDMSDPAAFFYTVARRVYLDNHRKYYKIHHKEAQRNEAAWLPPPLSPYQQPAIND
jgi:DNA-directed RNA polymerase specialized sigma24 family protein